jgi:hypothetical protein
MPIYQITKNGQSLGEYYPARSDALSALSIKQFYAGSDSKYEIQEVELPTYQELVNALCDMMDGLEDDEVQSTTGLPEEDAERIVRVRKMIMHMWQP